MQSRWYDFGGDTVIRTDQYETHLLLSLSVSL